MYYKGARAIIVAFDVTNPTSFEGLKNGYQKLNQAFRVHQ